MSLDVYLMKPACLYRGNVTHNLGVMARAVEISMDETLYDVLWRPDECDPPYIKAEELIEPLELALSELWENPDKYKELNPPNGWGRYENLCRFVSDYLAACKENPDADVRVCR